MRPVKILFGKKAQKKLIKGVNILADAVSSTLGPTARNVAINVPGHPPRVIHDGVNTAKEINLEDEFEDMGAQLVKEAALKTSVKAGDGTTTSTILAREIINLGFEQINDGKNPMILKKEIEEASLLLVAELKKLSTKIKGKQIEEVATISSADKQIGKMVAEAIEKVGFDGIVNIEEGKGVDTYIEYKQGLEFDRGLYSPYFITNQEKQEAVIENPYILLTDIKINHNHQIVPFLENLLKRQIKDLVIIGEVQEEALATLVVNKLRGALNVIAVQAPAFGDRRIHELEDISTLIGGTVISQDSGRELKSVVIEELGRADKVVADSEKIKIIGGRGDPKGRIDKLTKAVENAETDYMRNELKARLTNLSGKAATIYVGATSDPEMSDRKERVDDAVSATRAAVEEGIVAGGEIALLTLSKGKWWPNTIGSSLLREAIQEPYIKLLENAGLEIEFKVDYPFGTNVMDGGYKDLIKHGIIDPAKVVRLALENAVSVGVMALTTDSLISEVYRKEGD